MSATYARILANTIERVANIALPPCCRFCKAECARNDGLCARCWSRLNPIHIGCRLCGTEVRGEYYPICTDCFETQRNWDRGYAVASYGDLARDMVLRLKHSRDEALAQVMASLLVAKFDREIARADAIFAIPIHWRRRMTRGFNQSALIAQIVARKVNRPYRGYHLRRTRYTIPQSRDFDAEARDQNVADAFEYRGPSLVGQNIAIIDDVMTSGASLKHAVNALHKAEPQSVGVFVFARAPQRH